MVLDTREYNITEQTCFEEQGSFHYAALIKSEVLLPTMLLHGTSTVRLESQVCYVRSSEYSLEQLSSCRDEEWAVEVR